MILNLVQTLRSFCLYGGETDWTKSLGNALFSMNSSPIPSLRFSPYEIVFGVSPAWHLGGVAMVPFPLKKIHSKIYQLQVRNNDNLSRKIYSLKNSVSSYQVGDYVCLSS
jgi:hypothetical protein